jgi:hypothetical protein
MCDESADECLFVGSGRSRLAWARRHWACLGRHSGLVESISTRMELAPKSVYRVGLSTSGEVLSFVRFYFVFQIGTLLTQLAALDELVDLSSPCCRLGHTLDCVPQGSSRAAYQLPHNRQPRSENLPPSEHQLLRGDSNFANMPG